MDVKIIETIYGNKNETHVYEIGLLWYACWKRKVFSLLLPVLVTVRNEDGRLYQTVGPAHENERSPNFSRIRCRSYRRLPVERRRGREYIGWTYEETSQ